MLPLPEWVREERWVAQRAVLAHPAASLFISHMGGSQSMQEGHCRCRCAAVRRAPFFGDQHDQRRCVLKDKGSSLFKIDLQDE